MMEEQYNQKNHEYSWYDWVYGGVNDFRDGLKEAINLSFLSRDHFFNCVSLEIALSMFG